MKRFIENHEKKIYLAIIVLAVILICVLCGQKQGFFEDEYYTFAEISTLNNCISNRLLWCNTPLKYYTSITPNHGNWCNTYEGITPHLIR